jgi:large subunit ribosomal protein L1
MSFSNENLLDNIRSFMLSVSDYKPEGFKGKFLSAVHVSTTMGPAIQIELASVDPTNAKFMLDPSKLVKKD